MRDRLLLLALVAAGCASQRGDVPGGGAEKTSSESVASAESPAPPHDRALAILGREEALSWTWGHRGSARKLAHVTGRSAPVVGRGISPFVATMAFLTRFKDVFAVDDPASHFQTRREQRDHLGMTHLRLQQIERGIPVHGAEMMAHYDASGSLRTIDSTYVSDLARLDVVPKLTAAEALAIAERHFGTSLETSEIEVDTKPELVIHVPVLGAREGAPSLAYHLDLRTPSNLHVWMDYAIDALSGEVIESYNKVQSMLGSGVGVFGDTKALEISQDGSTYSLVDMTRTPNGIATYDAKNKGIEGPGIGLVPGSGSLPGELVTSTSPTSGWDSAAVDAHFYAGITYDYYKAKFGRKGIDDADTKIVSSVHILKSWNNAQWAEYDGKQMLYGDGDGVKLGQFSAALDVVAHELTHGVTFATSNLRYAGESGALNESISDVFGSLVEHYAKPHPQHNWGLGEDILLGEYKGKYARDLAHPGAGLGKQPAHMSEYRRAMEDKKTVMDLGGVHANSGIPNNAFYLMTMGGKNDVSNIEVKAGIGWEKVAQVWYRTNTQYLTESSGFEAAAEANLAVADDLKLTQNEKNIIECAWIAVGVIEGSCKTIVPQPGEGDGGVSTGGGGSSGSAVPPPGDAGSSSENEGPGDPPGAGGCSAAPGHATGIGGLFGIAFGALVASRRKRRAS